MDLDQKHEVDCQHRLVTYVENATKGDVAMLKLTDHLASVHQRVPMDLEMGAE